MKIPITISNLQKKNPLIKILETAKINWTDNSACDYSISTLIGVLFLSLKYHRTHPEYLTGRVSKFNGSYKSRVLLLVVDGKGPDKAISKLNTYCIDNNMNLVLAFDYEEAGRWLLTMYNMQEAQTDELKASNETNFDIAVDALNAIGISKKDAASLLELYGSLADCILQPRESLAETGLLSDNKIEQFIAAKVSPF